MAKLQQLKEQLQQRTLKEYLRVFGPAVILTLAGFFITYQFVQPAPPDYIRIASGRETGAYFAFAQQYRDFLAKHRIQLEVLQTSGSRENLSLLADGLVDIAFVQGGVGQADEYPQLRSLASLYFEPLWVFTRPQLAISRLDQLRGKRLAVGEEGSGTRVVALQLLEATAAIDSSTQLVELSGPQALAALQQADIDAMFLVSGSGAPLIHTLLTDPEINLMSFIRAEAFARNFPFLSELRLPQGVIDLAANLPVADKRLIAPTANLLISEDFHPALVVLLLQAAKTIHQQGGLFEEYAEFPSPKHVTFPLHPEARRYFESGPSFLERYLPFWAATLIDRMIIMLLPVITVLIPLFKIVPPTYRWRMGRKIYRWYSELQAIDLALEQQPTAEEIALYQAKLDRIENEVRHVTVPLPYSESLYNLRLHIDLIRTKTGNGGT